MKDSEPMREPDSFPTITERYACLEVSRKQSFYEIDRPGQFLVSEEELLTEHLLEVYLNEQLTMKLVCTPQYLAELVLGRLLTEGIIRRADEVKTLHICEYGRRARVYLTDERSHKERRFVETTPSCCTGSHILNDLFVTNRELLPVRPIPWKAEWIFALAEAFAKGMPLHEKTWGTHSCFLARESELLFACEDIGRHNALDKVIGYALRQGIDLSRCIVYSSGRIPTDMTVKAIRAGIPILASKAVPTTESVALAEQYGLTLLCAARRDRMRLYAGSRPLDL